jgi:N-acetylglucosamine-6-phosphate deacetylase
VRAAVAAGLRYVIHLGNGPTGSSLKPFGGGGLLEEALANDDLVVSLIVDGWHLAPRLVRDILERKGVERVFAVSDAGFAAGAPNGDFELLGVRGRVEGGGAYLRVAPAPGASPPNPHASDAPPLFGSAADMRRVVETILDLATVETEGIWCRRHPALALPEALALTSRLASANPAALLGERDRGHLRPGARADAILAEISGEPGRWRVALERVWVGGEAIPAPQDSQIESSGVGSRPASG